MEVSILCLYIINMRAWSFCELVGNTCYPALVHAAIYPPAGMVFNPVKQRKNAVIV